jgi:hypothetical protein
MCATNRNSLRYLIEREDLKMRGIKSPNVPFKLAQVAAAPALKPLAISSTATLAQVNVHAVEKLSKESAPPTFGFVSFVVTEMSSLQRLYIHCSTVCLFLSLLVAKAVLICSWTVSKAKAMAPATFPSPYSLVNSRLKLQSWIVVLLALLCIIVYVRFTSHDRLREEFDFEDDEWNHFSDYDATTSSSLQDDDLADDIVDSFPRSSITTSTARLASDQSESESFKDGDDVSDTTV